MEDVSDTARWVAFHRALESERHDALFVDPFAGRLAGERGQRIAQGMPTVRGARPGPRGLAGALAVRTKVFDELILDSIRILDADAVLNLAAGLDARPYRLPLPSSLVWIEADRAAILDEKTEVLASTKPACIIERVAVDLADDQARGKLFDGVAASHTRVVVVTEGLLVYLDEALVASLADGLRARASMRRWILESVAPEVLERNMQAWGKVLARANAEWKFARSDGFDFFRPRGWSPTVRRPFMVEARRLGRESEVPHAWLLRALSSLSARFRRTMENLVVYAVMEPSTQ
ncbi:MAG: class I SAM-dependent methyltransferase [Myxococcota bacterium]|nr:class I SAM-dependent methyltransferase [Myxococcota bacterium]